MVGGMLNLLPQAGGVEQGFGGDTTDMKASSTKLGILLHKSGFQSVLAGADGGRVAPRSAADHNDIVGHQAHGNIAAAPRRGRKFDILCCNAEGAGRFTANAQEKRDG